MTVQDTLYFLYKSDIIGNIRQNTECARLKVYFTDIYGFFRWHRGNHVI